MHFMFLIRAWDVHFMNARSPEYHYSYNFEPLNIENTLENMNLCEHSLWELR